MRKDHVMVKVPGWARPAVWGFVGGAVALAIGGFTYGGWVTSGIAKRMANDQSNRSVVAALVPICVAKANADPEKTAQLAVIKKAGPWGQGDAVKKIGWATFAGAKYPNQAVAEACAKQLMNATKS